MQVDRVRTPVSLKDFAAAFIGAWRGMTGSFPLDVSCAVVYAQWMVETSGRAFWNFNVGNMKATPAQIASGVNWIDLPGTWELIGGVRRDLPAGDPGRRFRAFASLQEGMREHLSLLKTRFSACWPCIAAGDPEAFTHAIKAGRDGIEGTADDYFTASVKDYLRLIRPNFDHWLTLSAFDDAYQEMLAQSERTTKPDVENPPSSVPDGPPSTKRIVDIAHPKVPLGRDDD